MLMHEQIPMLEQDIRVLQESVARLVSRVEVLEAQNVAAAAPQVIEQPKEAAPRFVDEPVKVARKK